MRQIVFVLFVSVMLLASIATAEDADRPAYRSLARTYAEAMINQGRDTYGERHAPVFATMLNRETMSLLDDPESALPRRGAIGIRKIDRSFNAANPDNDRALHTLLYRLSERRNEPKWAQAADASYRWFLNHAQHETTGLIAWGEHMGWRLDTDGPLRHDRAWGDRKHEIHGDMPWDKLFELQPAAAVRYAEGLWQYHVYDKTKGLHAHQTRWDTYAPDKGYVFPRMAGQMVSAFAQAHATVKDQREREKWASRINKIADTLNARRHAKTDAAYRLHPKRENVYPPFSDLTGVRGAHRALQLELPEATKAKLRDWIKRSDATFLAVGHDPDGSEKHPGWRKRVSRGDFNQFPEDLDALDDGLWSAAYTGDTPQSMLALDTYARYQQNHDQRFLDLVLEAADQYIGETPKAGALPLRPDSLAAAIDLMLVAHKETGKARYLEQADAFGRHAVRLFLDDKSALPKVFSCQYTHYEAISGGPDLMLALHRLGTRLAAQP